MDAATAPPAVPDPDTSPAANGTPRPVEVDKYTVRPLGDDYRRHRWIKPLDAQWADYSNRIMLEHGAVRGQLVYRTRDKARWRARRLIRLWDDLGMHERWELREHIDRAPGGWIWTIEHLGRHTDGSQAT